MIKDYSGFVLNEDARIVGVKFGGLWLMTTKYPRLKTALALVRLAWRVLRTKRYMA